MKVKVGQIVLMRLHGSARVRCRILAIHEFGTIDVERLSDGKCFRLTGLAP